MESSAGSRELPLVSVIIPIYGDAAYLNDCLAHLARQTYPGERLETIVIDNGCPGIEGPLARHPAVQCLREARPSSYAARNAGLLAARGEIIAFTDADCLPDSEWIERGVEHLSRRESTGVIAGSIQIVSPRPRGVSPTVYRYESVFSFHPAGFRLAGGFGATANLVVLRRVIDAVGLFDPALLSGGDMEWGWRAAAMGFKTEYVPAVRVSHQARTSIWVILRRAMRLAGGTQTNRQNRAATGLARMLLEILTIEIRWHIPWAFRTLQGAKGTRVERGRVFLLVVLVQVLRAAERIRVYLGGRPRRT
jgi:glycosyltransferase involved in cell wall biosynthesis